MTVRRLSPKFLLCFILLLPACAATPKPVAFDAETYTRDQLISDFNAGLTFILETHPDISYSASLSAIDAKAEDVRAALKDGMTAREAWGAMALLNPVFADAHVGFRRPLSALEAYRDNGGVLFPLPIVFDANGDMRAAASGRNSVSLGDRVLSINGISTQTILAELSPRMRGETPELGRLVLQHYFPIFFWAEYGGFDAYAIRLKNNEGAVKTIQLAAAETYAPSTERFSYQNLGDNVGCLEIATFNIKHLDEFKAFLEGAFTTIKTDQIDTLIIDIRENGGGANDLSDLLLNYLTDQSYSYISSVKARITEQNINLIPMDGVKPGMVLDLPFQQTRTPPADLANRFTGDVYILTGPMTYSAAIVFAATAQDYGFGVIAGQSPIGPANQTGQVQTFVIPHTKSEVLSPLYIFRRPNGDTSRSRIDVDIPIDDNQLNPQTAINNLISAIEQ